MNGSHFLMLYEDLLEGGQTLEVRGSKVIELTDYRLRIPPLEYITSFQARKLNLAYCKQEWLWYLRGDRFDDSIQQYATMWKKLKQSDGGFNSNYGQYIFEEGQLEWCIRRLSEDKYTRQASMQLLNKSHMYEGNTDFVCTHGINFRIRDNRLDMTVMMRSNDAIFGTTNDVFCFGQLLLMTRAALLDQYPELEVGTYTHFVNSIHVYERHWEMLERLVIEGQSGFYSVDQVVPDSLDDVLLSTSKYGRWLRS